VAPAADGLQAGEALRKQSLALSSAGFGERKKGHYPGYAGFGI